MLREQLLKFLAFSGTDFYLIAKIFQEVDNSVKNTLLRWDKAHIEAYNMYFHVN